MSQTLIQLESMDGFHVGGAPLNLRGFPSDRQYTNDGLHVFGQMYAQHFRLAFPCSEIPVAFWHGGGMNGSSWETTPDGRRGWLDHFLRAGFSSYLCDAYERGRASLPPEHVTGEVPEYRSLDSIWQHFRFGNVPESVDTLLASPRSQAYCGQQFPVEALLAFGQQFSPRLVGSDIHALAAYAAFLRRTGPCHVIGHSQGGQFAVRSAVANPNLVQTVVALEPPLSEAIVDTLIPEVNADLPPHLFVFGDYIRGQNQTWEPFLENTFRYYEILRSRGVPCEFIELPKHGITGNSHMLHMDRNSMQVATIVSEWIAGQEGR